MDRKNSRVVPLPNPSAMLAHTELEERLICETMPNMSLRGNFSEIRKTSNVSS